MLHRSIKTQEFVLAKAPIKKPASRRAPAARKVAPVKKPSAAPIGEGAPKPVEWPVVGAAKAAKKSEKVSVPPKTETAPAPVAPPLADVLVEPVAVTPEVPEEALVVAEPTIPAPAPAVAPAVATAAKKGTLIMTDAMETAKAYAEEAKSKIQTAVADMNEKAKVAMEKSAKAMEELGELTKGNYEAIVESSKIAAKGVETLSQEAVEYSRKSFEKSTATFKSFAAIKTPAEFFQLHSELMTTALDNFASEAAKSSEALLKLAGDVSQPISNRVAIVSEKVKALAA
jgi:phasin family protein